MTEVTELDQLNKHQLLAMADFIIGLERGVRLDPDEQQAILLGKAIITNILSLPKLERIKRLNYVVQEIKGMTEIEQAVADDYDNDPGEGGKL